MVGAKTAGLYFSNVLISGGQESFMGDGHKAPAGSRDAAMNTLRRRDAGKERKELSEFRITGRRGGHGLIIRSLCGVRAGRDAPQHPSSRFGNDETFHLGKRLAG